MNNILEEITYCDGKMGDVAKALYTPAKLKLRARTYNGINENLSRRRGPVMESATFNIPSAFMAVDVPSGNEGGSGYSVIQSENLGSATVENAQKKLKINSGQLEGIVAHAPVVESEQEIVKPPVEEVPTQEENVVPEVAQQETEMPEIAPINEVRVEEEPLVQPEIEPEVTNEVVADTQEVTSVEPAMDPLDAAREKVLNSQNNVSEVANSENEKDVVEQAEESDEFASLMEATKKNSELRDNLNKTKIILAEKDKELQSVEEILESRRRANQEALDSNEETRQMIDERLKEIANKKEMIEIKRRELNYKKSIVLKNNKRILKEQHEVEQEIVEKDENIKSRKEEDEKEIEKTLEIARAREELEKLNNETSLEQEKNEEEYRKISEVVDAVLLPEDAEMEFENDMEEVASVSDFPSFTEEDDYAYTYKRAA